MKVLIIEDEAAAARRLTNLVLEIEPDAEILADLDSIESVVQWVESNPMPDLIFMDVNLADGTSFEIFNYIEIEKPIIFTTAYDEYAIKAFKVNALDYILKPIKKVELETAIKKFKKLQNASSVDYKNLLNALNKEQLSKRFLIRIGQQIKIVEFKDAAYFYTKDKITFLITTAGKRYPIDYSLDKLEEMANPTQFFRINRQFIISMKSINEMYSWSKSRVKIKLNPANDLDTVVSTERSPHFKKWLSGGM